MPVHPYVTRFVPLSLIDPNPEQPRKAFDPADHEDLKANILAQGLLTALALYDTGDGRFRILGGERRFRVCKDLAWTEVEAKIWPTDTPAVQREAIALSDNLLRKDLNPIELGLAYQRLSLPPYDLNQVEIAEKVGIRDRTVVSRYIGLLDFPPLIQDFVARATISERHCRGLKRITDESAQIKLAQQVVREGWSVKETERHVNHWLATAGKPAKPKAKPGGSDPYRDYWEGLKISPELVGLGDWNIAYQTGKWSIELSPSSEMPMENILLWLQRFTPLLAHLWYSQQPDSTLEGNALAAQAKVDALREEMMKKSHPGGPQRFPKTPEEQANLEKLALQGPAPVYEWLFGPDHPMAQRMRNATWTQLEVADPVQGVRDLLAAYGQTGG